MDQLIITTAIPTIVSDLHGQSGFVWIGGAYLLANAAGSPVWAKLSDIWGRKAVLLCVVTWFAASSIICATAKNMNDLIIGRAFQGTAGGGVSQMVFITLSDIFSMRYGIQIIAKDKLTSSSGSAHSSLASLRSSGQLLGASVRSLEVPFLNT